MWIVGLIIGFLILRAIFNFGTSVPTGSNNYTSTSKTYSSPKPNPRTEKKFQSKNKLPDNFIITEEFSSAFSLMENTTKCAYITGKAGTGKSTLLTYFRQKTKKNIIVLAPTGIAAVNVEGVTIHSFFHFPLQLIEKKNIRQDFRRQELFRSIEMVIIDEISMVRVDMLDGIDYALRINRNSSLPFGGVQMIFFGDLYQLPPVVVGKDLADYFNENYGGVYFFNADVFKEINFEYVELQQIFRQKDENFKNILNGIRQSNMSVSDLNILNERYNPNYAYSRDDVSITLSTTNKIADEINSYRMNSLATKEFSYTATVTGKFDKSSYPTEPNLILKVGAQVMMVKNDSQKRWVNGSLGIVTKLTESEITVEIDGFPQIIERATWEAVEYEYNKEEKKIEAIVTGSFTQYALKLAWAITIHKSQGQTYDNIVIDLGTGAFAHGQTYVALSRSRTLEGITLKTKIRHKDIIIDPKVANFVRGKTKS